MKKIAVTVFPGMNCEVETVRALKRTGFDAKIVLWNEAPVVLQEFDGAVLPGGFSFEDRGRSGAIAAAEPILDGLRAMARQGKPILGICNGAQVLVEAGLVPDFGDFKVEMSLARNKRISAEGEVLGTGFFHSWVYIKNTAPSGRSAFSNFPEGTILKLPVAHGEGRFMASKEVLAAIQTNQMNVFSYCDEKGDLLESFPTNPNGSALNMAGVCNAAGNVLALMPHPERTEDGDAIFASLHQWFCAGERKTDFAKPAPYEPAQVYSPECDIEFFVSLKITDNTEKTLEKTLRKLLKDPTIVLRRRIWWGICSQTENRGYLAEALARSGEIFNENKENAVVKIGEAFYDYTHGQIRPSKYRHGENSFLALEKEDFIGQEKFEKVFHHLQIKDLSGITNGIFWTVESAKPLSLEAIKKTGLFVNPVVGDLVAAT